MNHYCVVLLVVCAIAAYTSAAATTAPTGGNDITTIAGNARNLVDKVVCAIDAFITLIQSIGKLGNGMGAVFLNPWITGLQAAARFLQQFLKNIPFLQGY